MKTIYETPWAPRVEIDYKEFQTEHQVFGLSDKLPEKGDRIQSYGGPIFELVSVEPLGEHAFEGVCRELR